MKKTYQQQHAARLAAILAALPAKADDQLKRFVGQFYAKTPVTDLERYAPAEAVQLAQLAYEFMQERPGNEPKIRIFTPQKNTVIELLNDDMPFLVDSLSAELTRHGLITRETIHPILKVRRDKKGQLTELAAADNKSAGVKAESLIHFEVSPLPEGLAENQLAYDLEWVLRHIRAAVEDWRAITGKVDEQMKALGKIKGFDKESVAEVEDFLRWLTDRNFIFMGYAEYDFFDAKGREKLAVVPDSRLGILMITEDNPQGLETLPPEMRQFLLVPQLVEITKSNRRSAVHRSVPMDYIGLKRFDADGRVIGEARFLGLFTSNVYYQSAEQIPLVRSKIAQALKRADLDPASHDGKALKAILEFLPRDEIFQMSEDELFETSMGILSLEARPGVRVFARRDAFERFVSLMVFVPREWFSTELRHQIQAIVEQAFNGSISSFSTQITETALARLHLIVKTQPGDIPAADLQKLENEIARRAYLWSDLLHQALIARHGEHKAGKLQRLYAGAFPQSYINRYGSDAAVFDIEKIEEAISGGGLAVDLFRDKRDTEQFIHLKIYNPSEEIALSDILPMLENAGFRVIDEHPFLIAPPTGTPVWIRDFKLETSATLALEAVKPLLEDALLKTWRRDMENDRFNALVQAAQLTWRQVTVLRGYAKYLKQTGFTYTQPAIEQAMNRQPDIARNLVALFEARFGLDVKDREAKQPAIQAAIEEQLAQVANVVDDRILRRYVEVISATLRTNYFQPERPVLSFKLDSARVPELPRPVPFAEIFVYSPRVEGIHLRGGKVARGGLRWSDRHEDFRTEILGLMKAQMVKNSVIVPVGSKGGFVVKQPPATRDAWLEEGIACYKLYLSGLLDITDNIIAGKITPPRDVVRHDGDDPYLVVAADKGTAAFSDIANGVAESYGFWLGDAFASGGSAGYDHKKMGITARGGWVSVVRHFREMGVDIGKQDFTVCGIGDMAGDVFGNGMLLSDRIRLVAAFNHLHIFLDPNPDTKTSFEERQRLFNLPRSTWKDYDAKLISKGGGIFDRSAKSIALSKEAQAALSIDKAKLTPDELIRAILLAPSDLLWNGGIGTYVKAEDETNEQVGDRANNAVRVNGKDLRCKVVGEGGNLGFTQKGRIEYARNGGRINTDAIDNSAGVDCSDHEVNIKIAFSQDIASGKLSVAKRDKLLSAMTEEVAQLVLKDNILQTQAISVAEQQGVRLLDSQARLMQSLEKQGILDRAIEFLPTDKQLAELKTSRKSLTRPGLAVLLAYSKMALYRELLESTLPDEPYFSADLKRYFPKAMQADFEDAINRHPLKREIIATVATNSLVNRAGITFVSDIAEDLGVGARDIASAYTLARDAFGLRGLWNAIEAASAIPAALQSELYAAVSGFLERVTVWLLRNMPLPLNIDQVSRDIVPALADIEKHKDALPTPAAAQAIADRRQKLKEQGVPEQLAEKIAGLELMSSAFDIISVTRRAKLPVDTVGKVYFQLGERLHLGWLRRNAESVVAITYWDRLGVQSIIGDLYDEQRRLTAAVIETLCKNPGCADSVAAWAEANREDLARFERFIDDLSASETFDLPKLMVALRHIRSL
ncbi:MAG: NAD-glutamate dehydrogenase [Pseudomonadota bacterium]|nr:NAD-glutamate dehydrogenase [Pseudomonadota bacterium]